MIKAKLYYIKEKQAFKKDEGVLILIGKPIDIAKKAKNEGATLIHIIDLDAQTGSKANFDIYDKLTYMVNIEVEGPTDPVFIEHLLSINARVVIQLPTKLDLNKWKEKMPLLVGRITGGTNKIADEYKTEDVPGIEQVQDIIIENADAELMEKLAATGKRIIIYKEDYEKIETVKKNEKIKKLVFAVLE